MANYPDIELYIDGRWNACDLVSSRRHGDRDDPCARQADLEILRGGQFAADRCHLALVNPVRSLDEAIEKANSLPYGLAGYAFTRSAGNADRLANEVEVGNLSINHFVASVAETPFGGVKDSGYGREGGTEGLQGYTIAKNISHKMAS